MAKKKKIQAGELANGTATGAQSAEPAAASQPSTKAKAAEPTGSSLSICRNKHWRYISSFHGPWLQLPPEILQTLADGNYMSPRPHPVDPAVFYDLVKIRKAVEEATNLAVRATSGLTSSALNSSLNSGNGMLGGAAALGIGSGGGGNTRMSRERKHRMRELATQKLSRAYQLDEVAASVATMQSASTLEDVASLVLQRNAIDPDAKYVHFFHEKIPARKMAQCTSLAPLAQVIADRPSDGSPLRTRALARIFKEDFSGAAKDLTEALAACRYLQAQHRAGKGWSLVPRNAVEDQEKGREHRKDTRQSDKRIPEEDQPSSLEAQLLFYRGGVYLTMAFKHVNAALESLRNTVHGKNMENGTTECPAEETTPACGAETKSRSEDEREVGKRRLEARKLVKAHARRALKDYLAFASLLEYSPGLTPDLLESYLQRLNLTQASPTTPRPNGHGSHHFLESSSNTCSKDSTSTQALVKRTKSTPQHDQPAFSFPPLPTPSILKVSDLFSSAPLPGLPPYPSPSNSSTVNALATATTPALASALADFPETVTYHPLLTDALHSLLLCHALLQTPPRELQRHAHNAARVARVCDGYPIFLAARSPARADWIEVLRQADNWVGLTQSWDQLCMPAPLPGQSGSVDGQSGVHDALDRTHAAQPSAGGADGDTHGTGTMSPTYGPTLPPGMQNDREREKAQAEARKRRREREMLMDTIADDRVFDEETFRRAFQARERRAREDEAIAAGQLLPSPGAGATASHHAQPPGIQSSGHGHEPPPKRWAQEDGKDYPISTDRAAAIIRWVREAPLVVEGEKKRKGKPKGRKGAHGDAEGGAQSVSPQVAGSRGEADE